MIRGALRFCVWLARLWLELFVLLTTAYVMLLACFATQAFDSICLMYHSRKVQSSHSVSSWARKTAQKQAAVTEAVVLLLLVLLLLLLLLALLLLLLLLLYCCYCLCLLLFYLAGVHAN